MRKTKKALFAAFEDNRESLLCQTGDLNQFSRFFQELPAKLNLNIGPIFKESFQPFSIFKN